MAANVSRGFSVISLLSFADVKIVLYSITMMKNPRVHCSNYGMYRCLNCFNTPAASLFRNSISIAQKTISSFYLSAFWRDLKKCLN